VGYQSIVQVIQRSGKNRQWYLICPAPLAQALEIEKGEVIEWVVEDKHTLILKRRRRPAVATSAHGVVNRLVHSGEHARGTQMVFVNKKGRSAMILSQKGTVGIYVDDRPAGGTAARSPLRDDTG